MCVVVTKTCFSYKNQRPLWNWNVFFKLCRHHTVCLYSNKKNSIRQEFFIFLLATMELHKYIKKYSTHHNLPWNVSCICVRSSPLCPELQQQLWRMSDERERKPLFLRHRFSCCLLIFVTVFDVCGCNCCSVCGVKQQDNVSTTRWGTSCPPAVCVLWLMHDGGSVGVRLDKGTWT